MCKRSLTRDVWGSRCGRADSVLDSHTTGPGFKTRLVRYFLLSFRLLTTMTVERSLVCVEGRGRITRSGVTQVIKMGSCVFQCDVPHQWIAQRQVGPVSVYCDGVGCRVLCLRHGISVWDNDRGTLHSWNQNRRGRRPRRFRFTEDVFRGQYAT